MSAQIVPFPLVEVVVSANAEEASGLALPFGAGSDDLTEEDIATIEEHLPQLRGFWSLDFVENDREFLSAVLHKESGWEAFRRTVVIQRQGTRLSVLMETCKRQMELGAFETATLALKAIGATLGLGSRRAARAGSPQEVEAEPGRRFPEIT